MFLCVFLRFHCIRLLKLYACKGFHKRSYEPGSPCSVFSCFIQLYFSILLNKQNDDDYDIVSYHVVVIIIQFSIYRDIINFCKSLQVSRTSNTFRSYFYHMQLNGWVDIEF